MFSYLPPSWEFFSNLDYECSVIMGKRKFTWSFPVCSFPLHMVGRLTRRVQLYLGCRWCPLFAIITYFVLFNLHDEVNCHVWSSSWPSCYSNGHAELLSHRF